MEVVVARHKTRLEEGTLQEYKGTLQEYEGTLQEYEA